jgi:NhaP-type Na+/H+ and K+/H+ antiporter
VHLDDEYWINLIVRDGTAIPITPDTTLHAHDEVLLLTATTEDTRADHLFTTTTTSAATYPDTEATTHPNSTAPTEPPPPRQQTP